MKRRIICLFLLCTFLLSGCSTEAKWQEQYDLGVQALYRESYEEAEAAFNAALEIDAQNAKTYIGLADAYTGQEKLEQAERAISSALELIPEGESAPENLAAAQARLGEAYYDLYYDAKADIYYPINSDRAVIYLEAAVKNGLSDRQTYLLLANAYMSQGNEGGQIKKAIDLLTEALEKLPDPSESIESKLEELQKDKAALDELTAYLSADDPDPDQRDHIKELSDIKNKYYGQSYDGERLYGGGYNGVGLCLAEGTELIYYGEIQEGIPNGAGVGINFQNSLLSLYTGQWKGGKPNGHGIFQDGLDRWEGNWTEGRGDGEFTLTTEDALWTMTVSYGRIVFDDRWESRGSERTLWPDELYAEEKHAYGFSDVTGDMTDYPVVQFNP